MHHTHAWESSTIAPGATVAVTGATGFVGRHLVAELVRRGYRVHALARDASKAARTLPVDGSAVRVVEGDATDPLATAQLVAGADACVHLVGIIREARGGQTFERVHVQATRTVVEACVNAGVPRYVHMSALGARPDGVAAYQRSKFAAEELVRGSTLAWTIFRPGLIHGPDGEFFTMLRGWCEGRRAPYFFLPYFVRVEAGAVVPGVPVPLPRLVAPVVAPVHVDDVAGAFCEALVRPRTVQEVISLSGPERVTWPEMLRGVRDALPLGKPGLRAVGLPGVVAAAKAFAAGLLGLGGLLPFDAGMALMGEQDAWADLAKAREAVGFSPRPFFASVRASVAAG